MQMHRSLGMIWVALVAAVVVLAACAGAPETQAPRAQEPEVAIESLEESPTPVPTKVSLEPSPEPQPTSSPEPVATPVSSPAPEPSPTSEPDATPEPSPEEASFQGQTVLEQTCTVCHNLGRVEGARKSREEWVATVARMIEHGAVLDAASTEILVTYLAQTYGP